MTHRRTGRLWLRAGAAALLGVALATLVWIVGVERRGALASFGMIALAIGPAFLALGFALALWLEGPETPTCRRRLTVTLMGMAGSVSNLLALMLLASVFIGVYAVLFAIKLFVPALAGGLGVGLGVQVDVGGPCR